MKIALVNVYGPKKNVTTAVLMDEGSTITLIEEELATIIGLKGICQSLELTCIGEFKSSFTLDGLGVTSTLKRNKQEEEFLGSRPLVEA